MAAGRDMVARLILSLTDRASAGLRAIQQRLQGLAAAARRLTGIGALVGAISFAAAIRSAASLEGKLRDIAIVAGRSGAAIEVMQRQMRDANRTLAERRALSSTDLVAAQGTLIGRGMEEAQAGAFMPTIATFTSATRAAATDIANVSFALRENAKITDMGEIQRAFAIALRSSQLGGFEARDMARHLGGQLAGAAGYQLTGPRAVATVAAMNQAALNNFGGNTDRAGEAVQQLLGQIGSEDFRRRFLEKTNLDTRAVRNDAARRGRDPLFALFQRMEQVLRGRTDVDLAELIPDQNARMAFEGIKGDFPAFRRIIEESMRATWGGVEQAAADQETGLDADLRKFNEQFKQMGENLGDLAGRLLPLATGALEAINIGLEGLNDILDGKLRTATGFVAASVRSLVDGFDDLQGRLEKLGRWLRDEIAAPVRRFEQGQEFRREQERQGPLTPDQRRQNLRDGRNPYRDEAIQPQSAPDQRSQWHGKIEIALAPGLVLRRGETDVPGISIGTDRGLMLRPI